MTNTIEDQSKEYKYSYYEDYVNITKIRNDLVQNHPEIFGNYDPKKLSRKRDLFKILSSEECKDYFKDISVPPFSGTEFPY